MSERTRRYLAYFAAAIVAHVAIVSGMNVLARVRIGGEPIAQAVAETLRYWPDSPVGMLITFLPFAAVAWICGSLARVARGRAIGLMAACLAVFAFMYYGGYMDSQKLMMQRKWTAATLAVGLIPYKSILVVVVAFFVRAFLLPKGASEAT